MHQRTQTEREADTLDMDVSRMVERLEAFAANRAIGLDQGALEKTARGLSASRNLIRRYMHRADVEMTK